MWSGQTKWIYVNNGSHSRRPSGDALRYSYVNINSGMSAIISPDKGECLHFVSDRVRHLETGGRRCLAVISCILLVLLILSIFKNISYPLFWADESMTVMGGVRVLQFGYPKVHDGKNVFYDLNQSDVSLGIDENTDAYIGGANWGQYYFAVPGIKLAEMTDDFYTKTAIIRTTFGIMGLAGLMIFAFLGGPFFRTGLSKKGYLALFVSFELISISLALNLREARYYSLNIFFIACCIAVYTRYRILKTGRYLTYAALLIVLLFFLFMTFSPAYFIFLVSLFIFESMLTAKNFLSRFFGKGDITGSPSLSMKEIAKDYFVFLLPVLISVAMVSPLISFFQIFHIGKAMAQETWGDRLDIYIYNLSFLWRYFTQFDFIYLAITLKCGLLACITLDRMKKAGSFPENDKMTFSFFLTTLLVVYSVTISAIPYKTFTRYFIALQPILALIIIVDAAIIYNFFSRRQSPLSFYLKGALLVVFAGFVFHNISSNIWEIKGHVYELTHQDKGPLDYVIPFIKNNYKDTEHLVIATNYEETSFMYYLGAKVIIGYVGNNLEADRREHPDIIVYRKGRDNFINEIIYFMRYEYTRKSFPVVDSLWNNLPELGFHRFRTEETSDPDSGLDIWLSSQ